jgi:hypothetical protein
MGPAYPCPDVFGIGRDENDNDRQPRLSTDRNWPRQNRAGKYIEKSSPSHGTPGPPNAHHRERKWGMAMSPMGPDSDLDSPKPDVRFTPESWIDRYGADSSNRKSAL